MCEYTLMNYFCEHLVPTFEVKRPMKDAVVIVDAKQKELKRTLRIANER